MGGACCVAAREKNNAASSRREVVARNARHSPSWSFRWENRGRVAGDDLSVSWFSDGRSRNDGSDTKTESTCRSENNCISERYTRRIQQTSLICGSNSVSERTLASDQNFPKYISPDVSSESVNNLAMGSKAASPKTLESPSPSSNKEESKPTSSIHVSSWRDDSSNSSDSWSEHTFAELISASRCDSFASHLNENASSSSSQESEVCKICGKLLREKSSWNSLKLVTVGELRVIAVLTCGHLYHAECLEFLTSESSKFDPSCPVCSMGEHKTFFLSQMIMKAEIDAKAAAENAGEAMASSSSSEPFFKRRFSLGVASQADKKMAHW